MINKDSYLSIGRGGHGRNPSFDKAIGYIFTSSYNDIPEDKSKALFAISSGLNNQLVDENQKEGIVNVIDWILRANRGDDKLSYKNILLKFMSLYGYQNMSKNNLMKLKEVVNNISDNTLDEENIGYKNRILKNLEEELVGDRGRR